MSHQVTHATDGADGTTGPDGNGTDAGSGSNAVNPGVGG
ncbi:PE family protein, partial [Mycobacterium tuberculosis]